MWAQKKMQQGGSLYDREDPWARSDDDKTLDMLKMELESFKAENNRLKDTQSSSNERIQSLQKSNTNLRRQTVHLGQAPTQNMDMQMEMARMNAERYQNENQKLQSELQKMKRESQTGGNNWRNQQMAAPVDSGNNGALQDEIDRLKRNLVSEKRKASVMVTSAQAEADKYKRQASQRATNRDAEMMKLEVDQYERENRKLKEQLEASKFDRRKSPGKELLKNELNQYKQEASRLQDEITGVRQQGDMADLMEMENRRLKDRLKQSQAALTNRPSPRGNEMLKLEVDTYKSQTAKLQRELDQAKHGRKQSAGKELLKKQIEQIKMENQRLQDDVKGATSATEMAELTQMENQRLKQKLQQLQNAQNRAGGASNRETEMLKLEVQQMQSERDKHVREVQRLKTTTRESAAAAVDYNTRGDEAERQIQTMSQHQTELENDRLKRQLRDVQTNFELEKQSGQKYKQQANDFRQQLNSGTLGGRPRSNTNADDEMQRLYNENRDLHLQIDNLVAVGSGELRVPAESKQRFTDTRKMFMNLLSRAEELRQSLRSGAKPGLPRSVSWH